MTQRDKSSSTGEQKQQAEHRPEGEAAHRDQREYPHGSGDRNTVSPEAPDDVDRDFHGGTQRTTESEDKSGETRKR